MERLHGLLDAGVIRRIGAVPNHYALGYTANGMSVWDVADERADELGARIGMLDFVSHCYLRPRYLPEWPYNLFAMVHGRNRSEVEAKMATIARLLGEADRGHAVLYSTRILKKSGLRLGAPTSNPPNPPFSKGGGRIGGYFFFVRRGLWAVDRSFIFSMMRVEEMPSVTGIRAVRPPSRSTRSRPMTVSFS
jgi:DNA-binding Lrp family transcriptional regulator